MLPQGGERAMVCRVCKYVRLERHLWSLHAGPDMPGSGVATRSGAITNDQDNKNGATRRRESRGLQGMQICATRKSLVEPPRRAGHARKQGGNPQWLHHSAARRRESRGMQIRATAGFADCVIARPRVRPGLCEEVLCPEPTSDTCNPSMLLHKQHNEIS